MTYAQEDAAKRETLRADLAAITKEAKAGQYDHFTPEQLLSELNMESRINKDLSVMVEDAWRDLEKANEYISFQSRSYINANKLLVEKHEANKELVSALKCAERWMLEALTINHGHVGMIDAVKKAQAIIRKVEGN